MKFDADQVSGCIFSKGQIAYPTDCWRNEHWNIIGSHYPCGYVFKIGFELENFYVRQEKVLGIKKK